MKSELRKEMRQLLVSPQIQFNIELRSAKIFHRLLSLLTSRQLVQSIIGGFAPLSDEPQWREVVLGSKVAFPAIHHGEMVFKLCSLSELVCSQEFGVKVKTPPQEKEIVVPHVVLVPGLAFGGRGERLGRGRGYYDRYLENFTGIKIGVCFDEQIRQQVPMDEHDQKMDYIVSESLVIETIEAN